MSESHSHQGPRPLYGVTIHHCIAGGNLGEMKKLVQEAEQHLREHGDVRASLELLKIEIAKLESRK
ncbi:MAG TPA: DUF1843 domain-containing protein [Candidatus Angelobacter sp.]|nr:DUF1843 domain-containing protein [Candidatus Angelobacter sp.]